MMDELIGFRLFLLRKGDKESTIQRHFVNLKHLQKYCQSFSFETIDPYLNDLYLNGRTGKYLNQFVFLLRLWDKFHDTHEFDKLEFFKEINKIKSTMSDEEIENFLNLEPPLRHHIHPRTGRAYTSHFDVQGYKTWTLFFSVMAYTGMRPGEVAHLTVNTIDFGRGIFILEDTKTNDPRFVPIPPNITNGLTEYVHSLKTEYLFPSKKGGTYKGNVFDNVDWGYNFQQRIKRLGIKRTNLTPYSLRHSLITRLLEEDVNLFKVQKIVGHRRISTTALYTHLTTKDLIETIKKHPLVRKGTSPAEILHSLTETINAFGLDKDPRFDVKIELNPTHRFSLEVVVK